MRWKPEDRYKLLLAINNSIIAKVTDEDLFQGLVAELKQHFEFDRLAINLYDPDTKNLRYFASAAGVSPDGILREEVRPISKAIVAKMVIESAKPVVIPDLSFYSRFGSIRSMLEHGLRSTMAFPLIIRSRIFGSLHFSFSKEPKSSLELSEVLKEVAKQVSIAVDNMLSYSMLLKEKENLDRANRYLQQSVKEEQQMEEYYFKSSKMCGLMDLTKKAAATDASILITGETGTGKDYLARYIHQLSNRRNRLFVKVNCPALSPTLFESELFGHSKGSFTGASIARTGRFEMADRGTIFLDEIGELPLELQAKLLHVLEEKKFERVGESKSIHADFRLIAATNRDLKKEIDAGNFRQDLYYRLNTFSLQVPPLRERQEGIPYLVDKLNQQQSRVINSPAPVFSPQSVETMIQYHWPGNVRELKNIIDRLVILKPGSTVRKEDITGLLSVDFQENKMQVNKTWADNEKEHLMSTLKLCRGRIGGPDGAAVLLDIPRTTLQYRLAKYEISPSDYKA